MGEPESAAMAVQDLIYAGLESIRAAIPVALAAYLHAHGHEAPQLYMAAPDLSAISPNEAFALLTAMRDALPADHEADDLELGDYVATAFTTRGSKGRGLFVAGRRASHLDAAERETFLRLARGIGTAVHAIESQRSKAAPGPTDPIRVVVEMVGGSARAEVSATFGDEVRTGSGEGSSSSRAVVSAVLDAVDVSLKLVEAEQGTIGPSQAVLVLLEDGLGRTALGSALVGASIDVLQATAAAAFDAASRLAPRA